MLRSRDDFVGKDPDADPHLLALKGHISRMMALFDPANADSSTFVSARNLLPVSFRSSVTDCLCSQEARARAMVVFEQQIATAQLGRAQMRDPIASYNKMPLADLQAMMPSFPFSLCILRSQSSQ